MFGSTSTIIALVWWPMDDLLSNSLAQTAPLELPADFQLFPITVPSLFLIQISFFHPSWSSGNLADARLAFLQWCSVLEASPDSGPTTWSAPRKNDRAGPVCRDWANFLLHWVFLWAAFHLVHAAELWGQQWILWHSGEHQFRALQSLTFPKLHPGGHRHDTWGHWAESCDVRVDERVGLAQGAGQLVQVGVTVCSTALWQHTREPDCCMEAPVCQRLQLHSATLQKPQP